MKFWNSRARLTNTKNVSARKKPHRTCDRISRVANVSAMRVFGLIAAVFGQLVVTVSSARILAVFPTPSYSHQIVYQSLVQALAAEGHQLVVLTPDPLQHPIENVTEISLRYLYHEWRQINFADINNVHLLIKITQFNLNAMHSLLSMSAVRQLLNDDDGKRNQSTSFDAVIVEYIGHKPIYAFASYFNAPLIGISSFDLGASEHAAVGNVHHPVIHPLNFLPYYGDLDIIERIGCVVMYVFHRFIYEPLLHLKYDTIIRHAFGSRVARLPLAPDLVLVNAHPALGYVRPMVPTAVPIGFMHIKPPQPLKCQLKRLLDHSNHGVIYFSLGTNVNSARIRGDYMELIVQAFGTLPYDVIMRWDSDRKLKTPHNVHLFRWIPQQNLLGE